MANWLPAFWEPRSPRNQNLEVEQKNYFDLPYKLFYWIPSLSHIHIPFFFQYFLLLLLTHATLSFL